MSGIDIPVNQIIVVVLVAPVGVFIIKWTIGGTDDAANGRFEISIKLRFNQVS